MELALEKRHWIGIAAGALALIGLLLIVINLRGPARERLDEDALQDQPATSGGRTAPGFNPDN